MAQENKMSLKVLIDNPKECYTLGESIAGKVQCSVAVSGCIDLCIKLIGEESTRFGETIRLRNFLEANYTVVPSGHLDEGEYEFRYKLTLPIGYPSSFVGKYGRVSYRLKGCMRSQKREKYEDVKELQIFSPIDLNRMEDVVSMRPGIYSEELQIVTCFSMFYQPNVQIWLDQNAYVGGEVIAPIVTLRKRWDFSEVKARLIMKIYTIKTPQTEEYVTDTKLVASNEVYLDEEDQKGCMCVLTIPDDINIPNFEKCFFFSQTAILEIIAVRRNTSKRDLKVEVELILGHIPVGRKKIMRKPRPRDESTYRVNNRLTTDNLRSQTSNLPMSVPSDCSSYPAKVDSPSAYNCPYSIEESVKIAPYPTTSLYADLSLPFTMDQKDLPPHPVYQEEATSISSVSHRVSGSSDSTPINHANASSSTVGSTAPYPSQISSVPMPMENLPSVRNDRNEFQVPVSDENCSQKQFQPSAPFVSEAITPPIDTIDEPVPVSNENGFETQFQPSAPSVSEVVTPPVAINVRDTDTDVIPLGEPPTYEETLLAIKQEQKKKKKKPKRVELVAS